MNKKSNYEKLLSLAYDNDQDITLQREEYQEMINELKQKETLTEAEKRRLKRYKQDLQNFTPQWIDVYDLKKILLEKNTFWKKEFLEVIMIFIINTAHILLILSIFGLI